MILFVIYFHNSGSWFSIIPSWKVLFILEFYIAYIVLYPGSGVLAGTKKKTNTVTHVQYVCRFHNSSLSYYSVCIYWWPHLFFFFDSYIQSTRSFVSGSLVWEARVYEKFLCVNVMMFWLSLFFMIHFR